MVAKGFHRIPINSYHRHHRFQKKIYNVTMQKFSDWAKFQIWDTPIKSFLLIFKCSGAFSRSAVNHNAGAKTATSNIIMAVTVMVTLLFLMPLFQYTPNVVLGAIIVTAVVGLIDLPAAYQIWKIDKFDFIVLLCAFLGVIFISVQQGLAIAVSSPHSPHLHSK